MTWKDQLLPGSFRGIPFKSELSDAEIGRRVVLHEYPLRDVPYAEDLGRKARRFTLDIYVLGAEYMPARDALIAAFETAGPGTLEHPYLGPLEVSVSDVRGPRESTREGGLARWTVTFIEAGTNQFPAPVADTGAAVDAAADEAAEALQEACADGVDTSGPGFLLEAATGVVNDLSGQLDALRRRIPGVPAAVTDFVDALQNLSSSVEDLLRVPADLAVQVYSLMASVARLTDRPLRALSAYRDLAGALSNLPEVPGVTSNRSRQAANQAAIVDLVHGAAAVEAARTAAGADFDSIQDAVAVYDDLVAELDALSETASDAVFAALMDLRAALLRDLAARGADLARLTYWTPPVTLPALAIAHRVYGDPTREAEIVARNHIRHPGFVTGGEALEVLIDAA